MITTTLPSLRPVCPGSSAIVPGAKAGASLYPVLCSREVLGAASHLVLAGMAGDGEPRGEGVLIETLQEELESRSYRPGPVVRLIGERRRLLSAKDRVVHTALLLVLDAVLAGVGADDDPGQVRTLAALRRTVRKGSDGFENFDIEAGGDGECGSYLDLLRLVVSHVRDDDVLRLLKCFLRAPVVDAWEREERAAG